jgi:hypothetical protein
MTNLKPYIDKIKAFYLKYEWQTLLVGIGLVLLIGFFIVNDTSRNEKKIDKIEVEKDVLKDLVKKKEDSLAIVNKQLLDNLYGQIRAKDVEIKLLKEQREVYYHNWRIAEGKIKRMTVSQMQQKFDSLYPKMK